VTSWKIVVHNALDKRRLENETGSLKRELKESCA